MPELQGASLIRAAALAVLCIAVGLIGGQGYGVSEPVLGGDLRLVDSSPDYWVSSAEIDLGIARALVEAAEAEQAEVDSSRVATARPTADWAHESEQRPLPVLQAPASVAAAIRAYDWPHDWATRTAFCESGFRPTETGAAGERGLMQIARVHLDRIHRLGFTWAQMYEVGPNLAVAQDLWREQGERPWKGSSECSTD